MDQEASEWTRFLTRANQLFRSTTHPAAVQLPVEGTCRRFDGATGWLNSPPLTAADLRGRVVLVNFWTYTCINWLRTLPYVRAWAEQVPGPGPGCHRRAHARVRRRARPRQRPPSRQGPAGFDYPVAVDNDYAIWTAFENHYWPALYFVDAQGQIRHHRFGEGDYEQSEMILQQLLTEAGSGGIDQDLVSVEPAGVEAAADWASLWSPENYLGYERTENFASPDGAVLGTRHVYAVPGAVAAQPLGPCRVTGRSSEQAIVLNQAEGRIVYRFHARDLHLVMAPPAPRDVRCGSACSSTGSRRAPPTAPTSTTRATAPSPTRGCTSSSASPALSASAPSRSPSSTLASRPTPSPSARPGTNPSPRTHKGATDECQQRSTPAAHDPGCGGDLARADHGLVAVTAGLFAVGAYLGRNLASP